MYETHLDILAIVGYPELATLANIEHPASQIS